MNLSLSNQVDNVASKLLRLQGQVEVILGSEFPNPDAEAGARDLLEKVSEYTKKLEIARKFPLLRPNILKESNYALAMISELLGFIIRSTTNRNLFELYHPLRVIAKALVAPDVRLILSSDWQFSPFTYPYGLDELPKYILIGLPATESENVLIFPTAGHELGHNIWRSKIDTLDFAADIQGAVYDSMEYNKDMLYEAYPSLRGKDIRNSREVLDIAKPANLFAGRQLEEIFCDIVGFQIFGASYLHAFDYVLSPTITGRRKGEYPSAKARASFLHECAKVENMDFPGYEDRFVEEIMPDPLQAQFHIKVADSASASMVGKISAAARKVVDDSTRRPYRCVKDEEHAIRCFEAGVPCSTHFEIGTLINAAWAVYNNKTALEDLRGRGVSPIPLLTDLVIKSAELSEYELFRC